MATLRTPWSRTMGLRIPVLNAPMGGVAGGRLASAVARAGGLGMIGIGSAGTIALLQRESEIPRRSQLPFGIGLLDWALERETGLLDAAIAAAPVLISVSFGDNWSWIRRVEGVGVVTATQVCSVEEAREAEDAGIQVLVARGSEGGGHGDPLVGTLPLMTAVLDAVSVPVLVAGGIASARGLAAVLAAGDVNASGQALKAVPIHAPDVARGTRCSPKSKRNRHCYDERPRHRPRLPVALEIPRASAAQRDPDGVDRT
jgi:nitronate monooxygenase